MRSPGTPISEDECTCVSALGPFVAAACGPPCKSESESELDRFQGTFVRILGRRRADTSARPWLGLGVSCTHLGKY